MAAHPITAIELCAGVGMLGEGARAGLDLLGARLRTKVVAAWHPGSYGEYLHGERAH